MADSSARCGWCSADAIVTASADCQGDWHGGLFDQAACIVHVDELFRDLGEWARACERDTHRHIAEAGTQRLGLDG